MQRWIINTLTLIFSLPWPAHCLAQSYENRVYQEENGRRMSYRLWLPPGHDEPGREFPLIVWLHGTGGSSSSIPQGIINAAQTERFAAYVVSPQGSAPGPNEWWWATCHFAGSTLNCPPGLSRNMESVLGIVDQLSGEFGVDESRRFVSGYSAGGMGAIEVVARRPDVFSTAVSISGGYPAGDILDWQDARVWTLHGNSDNVIPVAASRYAVDKIEKLGGSALHLEYPGGHEASYRTNFFNDPDGELYPWLFEGVEPTLAPLLYNPLNGNVKIDASVAPGGQISSLYLSSATDLATPSISSINGDELDIRRRSIRYSASDDGFEGTVDLGNILPTDLDFNGLHNALQTYYYNSPASSQRNRPFRLLTLLPGDFDADRILTVNDIDQLAHQIAVGSDNLDFDLNNDQTVDAADLSVWVKDLGQTWYGDANLDGAFDSDDLVAVLTSGEYEDGIPGNSMWSEGDWDADGEFASGDLVIALQDGGYEQGAVAATAAVPEPSAAVMLILGLAGFVSRTGRARNA